MMGNARWNELGLVPLDDETARFMGYGSFGATPAGATTPADAFAAGYNRAAQYDTATLVAFIGPQGGVYYFSPDAHATPNNNMDAPLAGATIVSPSTTQPIMAGPGQGPGGVQRGGTATDSPTPTASLPAGVPAGSQLVAWDHQSGAKVYAESGVAPSGSITGTAGPSSAAGDTKILQAVFGAAGLGTIPAGMHVVQVASDSSVNDTWIAPGWGTSTFGATNTGPGGGTVVTPTAPTVPLDEATATSPAWNWTLTVWDHGAVADPTAPANSSLRSGIPAEKTYADPKNPSNAITFQAKADNDTGYVPKVWRLDGSGNVGPGPMSATPMQDKYIPTSNADAKNHNWILHSTDTVDGTMTWFPPAGFVDPSIFLTFPIVGFDKAPTLEADAAVRWQLVVWDHDLGARVYVPKTAAPPLANARQAVFYLQSDTSPEYGMTHVWFAPGWGTTTGGAINGPMHGGQIPITSPRPPSHPPAATDDPQTAADAAVTKGWVNAGNDQRQLGLDAKGNPIPNTNILFWSPDGSRLVAMPAVLHRTFIPTSWEQAENPPDGGTPWLLVHWMHDAAGSADGKTGYKTYVLPGTTPADLPAGTHVEDWDNALVFPVTPDFGHGTMPAGGWVQDWWLTGWGHTVTVTQDPESGATVWSEDNMSVEGLTLIDLDTGNKNALYAFGPEQTSNLATIANYVIDQDQSVAKVYGGIVGNYISSDHDGDPYVTQARSLAAGIQKDATAGWPAAVAAYVNVVTDANDKRFDKANALGWVLHAFKIAIEQVGGNSIASSKLDQLESQMIVAAQKAWTTGKDATAAAAAVLHSFLQGSMPWVQHHPGTNEPTHEAEVEGLNWTRGTVSADGTSAQFTAPSGGKISLVLTTPVTNPGGGGGGGTGPGGGGGGKVPIVTGKPPASTNLLPILAAAGAGFLVGGPPGALVGAGAGWYLGKQAAPAVPAAKPTTPSKTAGLPFSLRRWRR